MGQFFKFFFASLLAGIVLFFLLIFFLIGLGASSSQSKTYAAPANSILHLDLNEDITEKMDNDPLNQIDFSTGESKKTPGLKEYLQMIKHAQSDPNIKGIYLNLGNNMNGYATIEALRNALKEFKSKGKFIYAYGEMMTQKSFYQSSIADKIYLNPNGGMLFNGIGRELMYFKNMFEKVGVDMQVFHVGEYKSAIEPFTRDKMTDANREQLQYLFGEVWNQMIDNIAKDRKIDTSKLNEIANKILAETPAKAKELGLVDDNLYYDQVLMELKTKVGIKQNEELELVTATKYLKVLPEESADANRIAVIYAEGEIVDGDTKEGIAGNTYATMIRKLREDDKVKAIVLRVNSPGGSALASDLIWREIILAKKQKPVVASFGDVAASGGYYISCAADKIYAQPNTITGSIGVFGLIPNLKKLYNEKLGITFDEVEMNEHAVLGGNSKPMDSYESMVIQRNVEKIYVDFKSRVAEGRKRDTADIETVAQGRVWTGTQAIDRGLVDEIGGIEVAIKFASQQAKLKDYTLKTYPEDKNTFEKLMESLTEAKTGFVKEELGDQYGIYETLKQVRNMKGIQARLPYFGL